MNLAMLKVVEEIPFGHWGPGTGLFGQFHDALALIVPEREAVEVARLLSQVMSQEAPALPGMIFTAEADIGDRLGEV
jgi:hypothetical protein